MGRRGASIPIVDTAVVVLIDSDTGRLTEEPDIVVRSVEHALDDLGSLTPTPDKALARSAERGATTLDDLQDAITRERQKWARRVFGRQPGVIPSSRSRMHKEHPC